MMKRRRQEAKTDYRLRRRMLASGTPRLVFRKTNRYVIGQYIESKSAQDTVLAQASSKELLTLGWPKNLGGSLKSLPACYLMGKLIGRRVSEKYGKKMLILDIGLIRNIAKSRIYAFVQGVVDAGLTVPFKKDVLPDEKRLKGMHLKKEISNLINTIAQNIEHD